MHDIATGSHRSSQNALVAGASASSVCAHSGPRGTHFALISGDAVDPSTEDGRELKGKRNPMVIRCSSRATDCFMQAILNSARSYINTCRHQFAQLF
jgi:hypothetical protein